MVAVQDSNGVSSMANPVGAHAGELLKVEEREQQRIKKEEAAILERESTLDVTLEQERKKAEETMQADGMRELQTFKQQDLAALLKTQGSKTQQEVDGITSKAQGGMEAAAATLVSTVLSEDFLSRL